MQQGYGARRGTLRATVPSVNSPRNGPTPWGICPDRALAGVTAEDFMSAGTGQADGSAPAPQPAGLAVAVAHAENWHHDVVARIGNRLANLSAELDD